MGRPVCGRRVHALRNTQAPGAILSTRRNHALEHATIAVLLRHSGVNTRIAGRASPGGFHIYGNLSTETVEASAREALRRLKAGERELALSPFCGTNLAVAGILAGLAALLAMGSGSRLSNLPRVLLAAVAGVLAAQPLGKLVQKRFTTQTDVEGMIITSVSKSGLGPWTSHRVETAYSLE